MILSLYSKLAALLDASTTDNYDLVYNVTGERFIIRPDNQKTFFEVYENAIQNNENVPFSYHNKSSYPLSFAFRVDLSDCHTSILSPLMRECNRSISQKCRRVDPQHRMIAFYTEGCLVLYYPLVHTITQESLLLSERLKDQLSRADCSREMSWHSRMVDNYAADDIPLYNESTHIILGCFSISTDTYTPQKKTPSELFATYIADTVADGSLELVESRRNYFDGLYHVYLSTYLPRVKQVVHSEVEVIDSRIELTVDGIHARNNCDIDYEAEDFVDLETLLSMWDIKRFLSASEWMTLGEVIYNHHKGKEYGYKVWETLTYKIIGKLKSKGHQVPSYLLTDIADKTEISYYLFPRGRITIETIGYVAREDSPLDYSKWHAEWCKTSIIDALSGNLLDVARAFYRRFWLDVMCEPSGKLGFDWYFYDRTRHLVVRDSNSSEVARRTLNKFRSTIRRVRFAMEALRDDADSYSEDEDDEAGADVSLGKIITKIIALEGKLATSFAHSVMKEAGMYFSKPGMSSFFDTNPDLTCVKTGVVAATRTDISFRAGRPQDYLTMETNAHLRMMDWNNPYVMKIVHWTRLTFIEEELVTYWFKFLASLIRGGNPDKIVPIIHGPKSNNGKSAWMRLISKSIGIFLRKGPMEVLTQPNRNPHGPTSMLSDFAKARLVICDEAESGGRPILAGPLKSMSGSDEYYTRRNFKEGEQVVPLFVLGIVTNSIPEMSVNDNAMRSRLLIWVMDTMFMPEAECPKTELERFQKRIFVADRYFDESIKELGNALLWIQYECYPEYTKGGLDAKPQAIKDNADAYWKDKDMYYQFEFEALDPGTEEDSMSVAEIQDIFNDWFQEAYPRRSPPTRPKLVEELTRRWQAPENGRWLRIKRKRGLMALGGPSDRCHDVAQQFESAFSGFAGYIGAQVH